MAASRNRRTCDQKGGIRGVRVNLHDLDERFVDRGHADSFRDDLQHPMGLLRREAGIACM